MDFHGLFRRDELFKNSSKLMPWTYGGMVNQQRRTVVLPKEVASKTIRLLRKAARKRSITPRLGRQMVDAAAKLETHAAMTTDGQVQLSEKQFVAVLRLLAYGVAFVKKGIAGLMDAIMNN